MTRTPQLRLSIIIINYRTAALVRDCLASLEPERESVSFRVVVVDNDSGDGSDDEIEREITSRGWSDWVTLRRAGVNGGFSAGNNRGIESADADAYLLLNSDTIVRPGAIRELLHALETRPDAGLIGPRLEWPDGKPQDSAFRWPQPRTELINAAATGPITAMFRHAVVALGVFDEPIEVEWLSFAGVLVRREVVEKIGPMDEGYFMYFEDIDYCRRAHEAGWRILHWPAARIVHLRGGTSPVKSLSAARKRRPAYYYASRARYYAKFYGRWGLWRANLYWMAGRCVSLLRELLQRKSRAACEREWRDNWMNALNPLEAGSGAPSRS